MAIYQKDFVGWAKVATEIERRERGGLYKPGAIYWCHLGVGIGSEIVGKGRGFTRPVLVLARLDDNLVFIVPITTKDKQGGHYVEIVVNGAIENVILYQSTIVDVKRLGAFIDEVMPETLTEIRRRYSKFVKRLLYKEQ